MTGKKIKSRKLNKNSIYVKNGVEDIENVNLNSDDNIKNNVKNKRIKSIKISMSLTKKEEKELDNYIEKSDNISIGVIVAILIVCFIVGISLGYILYRIAIYGAI